VSARDVRLRWIAVISAEFDADSARVEQALGLVRCFDDPHVEEFRIASRVYPIGPDRFLEIASPVSEGAAQRHMSRRGPGIYLLTIQVADFATHAQRIQRAGIRVVGRWEQESATGQWSSIHLHPADVGATLMSLDWCAPPEEFPPLEADWRRLTRRQVVDDVVAVEVSGPDPESIARRWGTVLGVSSAREQLRLGDTVVRFTRSSGLERVGRVSVRAADAGSRGAVVCLGSTAFCLV
jgi:hypothetical protein